MPTSYTHYRFGCDVLAALPPTLQERIAPHRPLFDIGLHGPDVFFYTNPLIQNPVNRLGSAMHNQTGETVFRRFAALDDGTAESFAYLAGFLCHFALDSVCHGYVEQMAALGMSHNRLETQLDRSFLLEDGNDPVTADLTAHIDPSLANARSVSRFFPQFSLQTVQKALKQMIFYHHVLQAKTSPKRWLLDTAFRTMGLTDSYGAMVMTETSLPACESMVRQLHLLYAEAIPLAAALIQQYPDLRHPHYQSDFNGGTYETDEA